MGSFWEYPEDLKLRLLNWILNMLKNAVANEYVYGVRRKNIISTLGYAI